MTMEGVFMSEDAGRLRSLEPSKKGVAGQYRFLPDVDLPHNLPAGTVAIAEMANAFGVTHRTLHFYEEKGLITASRIGPMRVYDHQDVLQMSVINICREIGMPISVIQELMEELQRADTQEDADRIFREALSIRKRELISGLSTVHRQMQQVTILLDRQPVDPTMATNDNREISLISADEQTCLQLMAEGYTPHRLARAFDTTVEVITAMETGIVQKLNANNRFQAIAKAVLLGIVHS